MKAWFLRMEHRTPRWKARSGYRIFSPTRRPTWGFLSKSQNRHIFKDVLETESAGLCNLEVNAEWTNVAKSVGMLQFVSGGGEALCSGTLLNDQASDQAPYLLTANHCFSTQTEAQSLRVYWNYNSGDSPPAGTPLRRATFSHRNRERFYLWRFAALCPWDLFSVGCHTVPYQLRSGIHHLKVAKRVSFGLLTQTVWGPSRAGSNLYTRVELRHD